MTMTRGRCCIYCHATALNRGTVDSRWKVTLSSQTLLILSPSPQGLFTLAHAPTLNTVLCPCGPHPPHLQAYMGTALNRKIDDKVTVMPDLANKITIQQESLGKAPLEETAKRTGKSQNTVGIIVGSVVGFCVACALVVLAIVLVNKRRATAAGAAAAANGIGAAGKKEAEEGEDENDGEERIAAGPSTANGGPVAESVEDKASSFYQQRSLRAQAALQRHLSSDGGASKGAK